MRRLSLLARVLFGVIIWASESGATRYAEAHENQVMKSNRLATTFVVAMLAALAACGGKGPSSGPTPISNPVTVSPQNFKVLANTFIVVGASGGDGQNYAFTLPAGGGSLNPRGTASTELKAGGSPGSFVIRVSSGNQSTETGFEVITQSYVGIVSQSATSGSTLAVNTPVTFHLQYVSEHMPAQVQIFWVDDQKNIVFGSGFGGAVLSGQNGEVTLTVTMTKPAKVSYLRVVLMNVPPDPYAIYNTFDFPISLIF
jgi:hypothetical protein